MVRCPNCSAPVAGEPVACRSCGYRSEMAPEYFWMYAGGGIFVLLGFLLGTLGVLTEGSSPGHWSRGFQGWFPLAPWPAGHHWLAFIVAGIGITLMGLGVTRRRLDALIGLLVVLPYSILASALGAAGAISPTASRPQAALVLAVDSVLLLLALRIAGAYRRTPPRRLPEDRSAAAAPTTGGT